MHFSLVGWHAFGKEGYCKNYAKAASFLALPRVHPLIYSSFLGSVVLLPRHTPLPGIDQFAKCRSDCSG